MGGRGEEGRQVGREWSGLTQTGCSGGGGGVAIFSHRGETGSSCISRPCLPTSLTLCWPFSVQHVTGTVPVMLLIWDKNTKQRRREAVEYRRIK